VWIAVDIDNTIANTNLWLVRAFNITLKKYPAPEVPAGFFDSNESIKLFQDVEPFPDAAITLQILEGLGFKIAYISSRPKSVLLPTLHWLKQHEFPKQHDSSKHHLFCGLTTNEKKVFLTQKLHAVACFEDDPVLAKSLLGEVPVVWLKDWPYNHKIPAHKNKRGEISRVTRFDSWWDVYNIVLTTNYGLADAVYGGYLRGEF